MGSERPLRSPHTRRVRGAFGEVVAPPHGPLVGRRSGSSSLTSSDPIDEGGGNVADDRSRIDDAAAPDGRIGRRQAIGAGAVVAGAAWVAPAIVSVPAASAATVPPTAAVKLFAATYTNDV